ncbi:MAG: hypothetical protein ACRYFU_08080 [Janthinobacterium lividum]
MVATAAQAQNSDPAALAALRLAVAAELNAAKLDHHPWDYRDHDVVPEKDAVYHVIETPHGDLHRLLSLNGQPLTGADEQAELQRLRDFVNNPDEQARKKKDATHDGDQARELLTMLPNAFIWSTVSENAHEISLRFRPDPGFKPPDMQARVLGTMAGNLVIAREGNRIQTLRGTLTSDVKFGFGIFGKIDQGGTFDIERRQIRPGLWQITETHVHIGGKAVFFKTIGQQDDDVRTDWKPSTAPDLQTAEQQIAH